MPCTKCEEGKYKWGKTGECKYDSLEACESANTKYNKMQPTPLGKKQYEEYAKELKEFNLSKVEKIELNDVKKLAMLGNEADDFRTYILGNIKTLQTLSKAVNDAKKEAKDLEKNMKSAKQLDKDIQKIKQIVQSAAKELGINANDIPDYSDADEKQARLRGELDQAERTLSGVSSLIKF